MKIKNLTTGAIIDIGVAGYEILKHKGWVSHSNEEPTIEKPTQALPLLQVDMAAEMGKRKQEIVAAKQHKEEITAAKQHKEDMEMQPIPEPKTSKAKMVALKPDKVKPKTKTKK